MSFYNTYRPQILADIDNADVRKTVTSLLSKPKEKLPHAFLLTGPRGTGKTTTARIITKLFNCTSPLAKGEPCGTCDICVAIEKGKALDILEIDAASNTGVDNIRDLKDKIMLAPSQAKWKVYIIDEVHMLSTGAFNALLKTLEEPPANTVFILATTHPQKVPETIHSRCVVLPFNKPKKEEIIHALTRIVQKEKLDIEKDILSHFAEASDGSFRDATKLLEQASLLGKKVILEDVKAMLHVPKEENVHNFIKAIDAKDIASAFRIIDELMKEGADLREFFAQLIRNIQKLLVFKVEQGSPDRSLQNCLDIFHTKYLDTTRTNFPEIPLQLAVLLYCSQTSQHKNQSPETDFSTKNSHPQTVSDQTKQTLPPKPVTKQTLQPPTTVSSQNPIAMTEFSVELLTTHWGALVNELKQLNHSIAGVLRTAKPVQVSENKVVIEAFYTFHKDKLSQPQTKEAIAKAISKLFGKHIALEVILGKK